MASEQYKKLIDELCKLIELPVQAAFYERIDLEIDKAFFSLVEAQASTGSAKASETATQLGASRSEGMKHPPSGMLAAFCDFGPLPRYRQVEVMQRLLELNLSLQGEDLPVMAMNHENGHVLLCRRLPLAGMTAPDLLDKLGDHAEHSRQWRNGGCFLEGSKPATRKSEGARRQLLRFAGTG